MAFTNEDMYALLNFQFFVLDSLIPSPVEALMLPTMSFNSLYWILELLDTVNQRSIISFNSLYWIPRLIRACVCACVCAFQFFVLDSSVGGLNP